MAGLTLWIASKAAAFLFLIERAYIISWPITPRHKTPDYVLSYIVIFSAYFTVTVLSIKFRVAFVLEPADICIIGIQMYALIPLLLVEVLSYLYLTIRFLIPLVMVHFGGQGLLVPLRKVVIRTCIGTVIAMLSTAAVKISLTLFNGEPAWLCCMTCKIDALIACTTLHWITKPEATEGGENGTPQTLGVGFDENDKESGVVVETSQVSDNQRAASNSTTLV
ncbi:uncharacterized protein SEPMUDRAFT_72488 [Sphaerulina musiva SO2202]|uniref:Integral membrane protein n=1 Tax=Sphaerulina musiva (strain SO2202) TaxID=692275 RepID=N1QI35_SPHMS|nr:uncharacterized protein SEPMUDRAFT_72488 [Sphaerulina musiva SO2202]EMF09624.1 hypothetical protein SEPMUDRAFT_72488 [Sphaerulina musiva SO2202]